MTLRPYAEVRRRSTPLRVQIFLLLLGTITVAQVFSAFLIFSSPPAETAPVTVEVAAQLLRDGLTGETGKRFVIAMDKRAPYDDLEDAVEREYREVLARHLDLAPGEVRVVLRAGSPRSKPRPEIGGPGTPPWLFRTPAATSEHPVEAFSAALRQADGSWLVLTERQGLLNPWERRALLWLSGSVLVAGLLGYLFARRLTAPILSFAEAAERLGRDPRATALVSEGPAELGAAARAFNDMQDRLRRYVEDRTAMVGAIAHDLRTPLTRLAFRLESGPEELRIKAAGDIAEMEAMINAALVFVRDATRPAHRERLELGSLVESVCADMAETGSEATFEGGDSVVLEADPLGLRRVVTNLLANACRYGLRARVRVSAAGGRAIIEVDDDGPGLAVVDLDRVFEPFYRVERSRSRRTGGVGLGLSVVRAIVLAHGGTIAMRNRPEGGLRVRVTVPL
jgi:two-component system OmpR family sensor kinase